MKNQKRQKIHFDMRFQMEAGDLKRARSLALEGIAEYGPHLGLLCDLAGCEYEMGQFESCEEVVNRIEREIEESLGIVSPDSLRKSYLMLSKFYEEFAQYDKVLELLEKAQQASADATQFRWAALQQLRVLSFLRLNQGLAELYQKCDFREQNRKSLDIETLHGLMWAEGTLFGWNHAEMRFREIQSLELNKLDRRLICRDFIEISLFLKKMNSPSLEMACSQLTDCLQLDYDVQLLNFFKSQQDEIKPLPRTRMSLMMKLRLILIEFKITDNQAIRTELRKKFLFLLEDVSRKSRTYLISLLEGFADSEQLGLRVLMKEKILQVDDKTIGLTKTQFDLLCLFSGRSQLDLDAIGNKIWQGLDGRAIFDRTRMQFRRLNDVLEPQLGFYVFEVTKVHVRQDPRVKIVLT